MFDGRNKWVKPCLAGMLLAAYLTTLTLALTVAVAALSQRAEHNAPAFSANSYTFDLAKDIPGNSAAVSVGSAPATDLDPTDTLTYSLEPLVYMLGNDFDALYTLNTDTGVAAKVSSTTTDFGVGEVMPTGLVWHKNKLYMVGKTTDALYTVDPGTGATTRVGIHHRFGIREDEPWGMASDGSTLHMVGSALDHDDDEQTPGVGALYSLNTSTGAATRVGIQDGFGVSENSPAGLSWHNGTLYMLGDDTDALYTVNTTTGTATKVGSATAFGVDDDTPGGLASSGGKLYMTGRSTYALYTLDADTGVATQVGSATAFGVAEYSPAGMATPYHPSHATNPDFAIDSAGAITYKGAGENTGYRNFLAVVSDGSDKDTAIVQVTVPNAKPAFSADSYDLELPKDTSGSLTALEVGSVSATDADTGDTVSYSLRPLVYMVGQTNKALYTLDIDTGVATRVDSTTTNFGAVSEERPTGLAWLNGKLYMTGQTNDTLYTVDVVTGVATKVGASTKFGIVEDQPWGLASSTKDSVSTLHMVGSASNGGGETNNAALYTLNTDTGSATRVGEADNFGSGGDYSPTGLSWHKDTLYMLGQQYPSLYGLSTSDGNAQFNKGAYDFHVAEVLPAGLASVEDKLYMTGQTNEVLYQVDIASSLAVRIGNTEQFGVGEDLPTGIAPGYDPSDFAVSSTGAITYNGDARSGGTTLFFLATATDGEHEDTAVVRVTVTTPDTASLSPVPSAFTVGAEATKFTLTTNVSAGIKVKVTQGSGTVAMSAVSGTPSCVGTLDIEEDVTNGGKVKMTGCTEGGSTVKLLKDATELASYTVTVSPPDVASLSPVPSAFTVGADATEFTLTTNVSNGIKAKVTQGTGTVAMSAVSGTPSCSDTLDIEEDVRNGGKVKMVGCTEGTATVKLLKDTTELASYTVTILPLETATLSPEPSAFTVGADATEFTLTTNVSAGINVKVTQDTGTVALAAASGTPSCSGALDIEEDVTNGGKVKMVGCTAGSAMVKLLKGATELASYTVTVSPRDVASLSPVPSAFTVGADATEFTLTTNVSNGIKAKVTQGTGTVAMSAVSGTPSCSDTLDIEEDVRNGGKVKMVGCTEGTATVKLLKDTTELASYTVTISPLETASLSPVPSTLTVGNAATEFTLTTNVSAGIKVEVTQGTGAVALAAAKGTPSCIGTLDTEEDLGNGGMVKIVGCTAGSATVKLLKDTTELASYTVTISPLETASLSPVPSTLTVGADATEFTLTTNINAGIKVKVTQGSGTVAMSAVSGTPSCVGNLDTEEDVTNGDKVKIVGCSEGSATVKLLKGATELASYAVAVSPSPPDTASLSPEPSTFTIGNAATEFTLTTNVSTSVKVKVTQDTGTVAMSAYSGTPTCSGTLDIEEDVANGGKVKTVGCTAGSATVKLLKDTTELASYTVTISPLETASLSPVPSTLTVGADATEFTLTTNINAGIKVKVTQGSGTVAMSAVSGTPSCVGNLDTEEDVTNGDKVKIVGCSEGSATVKLLKDTTELASYTVAVSPTDTASLSPVPSTLTVGADATEFTLTTNINAGIKVEVTQDTGSVALAAASGTPSCSGALDIEEDVTNGDKVKMVGCTAGSATVKLLKDTTELASYTVTISPLETASLSPVPSALTVGNAATEFTLTTNVSAGIKVEVTQGTGAVALADANGTPSCIGTLDTEEDLGNGGMVKIVGCTAGSATVKLLKDTTELASYTVAVSRPNTTRLPPDTASLSSEPSAFTVGAEATEFTLTTNVSAGIKVEVTQGTGAVALAAAKGTPSCIGTLDTEEDLGNGGMVKMVGCTAGSATVKLLKGTTELAIYTVAISPPDTASLSPVPSTFTMGTAATEFTLTTNVSTSVKVEVIQGTGTVALAAASDTPSCTGALDSEEDVTNGGKVKMVGCTEGNATVKLLKGATELASYTVAVSPLEMASLSPVPSTFTVRAAATEFTLTTNVNAGIKVEVTQGTGTVALAEASAAPSCSDTLDIEEDMTNGDKVKIVGCTEGDATIKLLKGTTELASYTVAVSPPDMASLSPVPSTFAMGAAATEFTLTTNVSTSVKVKVTQDTGTVAISVDSGTPSCIGALDTEEDLADGDKVKMVGCTEGDATVKLLKDTTELASYAVTISPPDTASLSPVPATFTMGADATEFTLTTNVSNGIKVKVTQGTGTVALAEASSTPSCMGALDTEEDVSNGDKVKIVGCTAGSATVKLLKGAAELASYTVTISRPNTTRLPPDTASLSSEPSAFTVGAEATEFTLTTNVSADIKVEVTRGTGTVALAEANGTPSCSGTLDIEEDLGNGDKVKMAGCTAGSATVKLLKDTTELASYTVTISPPDTASLSPVPSAFTMGNAATEFTLTTNVSTSVKVKVTQDTGSVTLAAANDTPSCSDTLDIEEDLGNGDKVKMAGCTAGSATVKLLKDTTELASYTVTISPPDTASLSPVPSAFTMGTAATEFTLTTNVSTSVKVKVTQGTGTLTLSSASGTPTCSGTLDIEEDLGNGDKVKMVGCTAGSATVKLLKDTTELASYTVAVSPPDTASLSPVPSTFTMGTAATEFTLTTNVSTSVKVKVTQGTDSVALSAASSTPSCSGTLNVEEDVSNGDKVKIAGCTEGNATVKLLKGATELASYTVTILPPDTASLSPVPSAFTVGAEAMEFTLTTNVSTSVKVKVTQGTDSVALSAASSTPSCSGTLNVEEDVSNGDKVKIAGCTEGTATVKLLKDTTELASYTVTISPLETATLSPEPSAFTMGTDATEFTLTTNVSTSVKVKVTQDTGTVAMSSDSGTPSCSDTFNVEEDLGNGDKVKIVGCTAGSATVKLLKGTNELASYTVTISPPDTASLSPVPSAFTVGAEATEFTLTTNVSTSVKVKVTQDTGTVAMSADSGTPSCSGTLDIEEDVSNGDNVKIAGCTEGDATIKLVKGTTELASYAVMIAPPDTASLSPVPSAFTVGAEAMEFTLSTNVLTSVKVEVTQATDSVALSAASGTPSCSGTLNVEEDVSNGDKVKIAGCTEGSATVKLFKDTTELASYTVTISLLETASLSPEPSAFTMGTAATEFTLTTNVSAGIKVKVTQATDSVALSAASGTPSCSGTLDTEEDLANGGKVKMVGCTAGSATVKLLKDTTELASYAVTVTRQDETSLSIPAKHSMVMGAVESFKLTIHAGDVWVGVNYDGNNHLGMDGDCPANTGGREANDGAVFGNGDTVNIKACHVGTGEVRIYQDSTELSRYTVTVTRQDKTSLSIPVTHSMDTGTVESFKLTTPTSYLWVGVNYDGKNHLGVGGDCPADNGGREANDGAVFGNGDTVSIKACSVGTSEVRIYQGITELASYIVTASPSDTASLSPEPSTFTVGNAATEFTLTTNVSAGIKVKVAQVTDSVALSAASGTPSCSGTLNVEEDVSNGGKVKIVGCTEGSATVKLLKGTSELASYTVTVPATAGLSPALVSLNVGESQTFTVMTSIADSLGVWVGVNKGYDTGSLTIDGGSQGSDCNSTGDNNGRVRTNGQSVTIRGCSAGTSTIYIYKYQQMLASYSILVTEMGPLVTEVDPAPLSMDAAYLLPGSLKVGQFHIFTLETSVDDSLDVWVGVNYGGTGNMVIDGHCLGADNNGMYFSNGDTVVIIACSAGTGDIRIYHGNTILANYTVMITGAS